MPKVPQPAQGQAAVTQALKSNSVTRNTPDACNAGPYGARAGFISKYQTALRQGEIAAFDKAYGAGKAKILAQYPSDILNPRY